MTDLVTWSRRWCWLVLALVVCAQAENPCRLADFLTTKTNWELRVSQYRVTIGAEVMFTNTTMVEISYDWGTEITRTCLKDFGDHAYLLTSTDPARGTIQYECYKFTQRSAMVVQIRRSDLVINALEADSLCEESKLEDDPWLLVFPWMDSEDDLSACGLQGGFDFHVFENEAQFAVCDEEWLKPRLEVGCIDSRVISLDFRAYYCQGELDISSPTELNCVASWIQGNYTFTVVTDSSLHWPKMWVLRIPRNLPPTGTTFGIVFSPRIYVDTSVEYSEHSENSVFYTRRSDFPSTCEDEGQSCELCSSEFGTEEFCLKSCGLCGDQTGGDCVFESSSRGEWEEIDNKGARQIAVTNSVMYVDGFSPLQCQGLPTHGMDKLADRYALVSLYKNGCKPRYMCAELVSKGANIAVFRFGEMVEWPHKTNLVKEDICRSDRFNTPLGPSQEYSLLVRSISLSRERDTVSCDIRGDFHFQVTTLNSTVCVGVLRSCDFRDVFHMTFSEDCAAVSSTPTSTYHCIGTYDDNGTHFIVTELEDQLHCWAIFHNPGETFTSVYKLQPADCTKAKVDRIKLQNGASERVIQELKLDAPSGLDDELSCHDKDAQTSTSQTTQGHVTSQGESTQTSTHPVTAEGPPVTQPWDISDIPVGRSASGGPASIHRDAMVYLVGWTLLTLGLIFTI